MTRLLASVTDADEAETAVSAGADIIDLKDPARGALGALPLERIRSLVEHVAGRRPVSATIGDLPAEAAVLTKAIRQTAATGVDYVKAGFFSAAHLRTCLDAISGLAAQRLVVAVLFADRCPPLDDLAPFARAGLTGVMLDTADKRRGHLLDHATLAQLHRFVEQARSLGLLSGLAGSLRQQDIASLLPLGPDYLGFRGALCAGARREQRLDADRLRAVRRAIV
jgi:dihydroneopterin aldolase